MDLTQEANVGVAIDECGRVLAGVEDPARRRILLARMAQHLGIDESTMVQSLGRGRYRSARTAAEDLEADAAAAAAAEPAEEASPLAASDRELLACVLALPELVRQVEVESVELPAVATLLGAARAAVEAGARDRDALVKALFARCAGDAAASRMLGDAVEVAGHVGDPTEAFGLLQAHRTAYLGRRTAQQIRFQLRQAQADGDQERVRELTRRFVDHMRGQGGSG